MIVYLHGYWSSLDLINWAIFPLELTNLAEQAHACVAMPFGLHSSPSVLQSISQNPGTGGRSST